MATKISYHAFNGFCGLAQLDTANPAPYHLSNSVMFFCIGDRSSMADKPIDPAGASFPFDFSSYRKEKIKKIVNTKEGFQLLQRILKESEERFTTLYRGAPFGYDSLDENAHILEANEAWLKSLGYAREEVIGKPLGDFLTADCRKDFEFNWEYTKKSGSVNGVILQFLRRDGSQFEASLHGRVLYDSEGRFVQTHGVTYDLTEQKKADEALRKSEREKALILGIMSDRVMYLDPEMKVIWANGNTVSPFHLELEQLLGTRCYQTLYHRDRPCTGCLVAKALKTLTPEQGTLDFGATSMALQAYPVLGPQGGLTGIVQVAQEITERKQLERDILDISTRERQGLGRDLHDGLGQFLTGIAFLARVLQQNLEAQSLPEAKDAAKISDIAERASLLARNLAKGLYPFEMDTDGYLGAIADLAMTTESLYGIACSFDPEIRPSLVDNRLSIHLYYIAQEAINNAVKHGQARHIKIKLEADDSTVTLTVADDGKGLRHCPKRRRGMGLRTMSYRAGVLGGNLAIGDNEHGGATLTCSFPLAKGSRS
jgi:PAS domain S-box-containing protein